MSITIFSRPIRTGKTTELLQWCDKQKNIAGIAMPDISGFRKIIDLTTHATIDAEYKNTGPTNEELIEIGKYKFYKHAFDKANEILIHAWASKPGWLVIDELGKLELKGQGFFPAVKKIIAAMQQQPGTNILIVVREGLVDEIARLFQLKNFSVVQTLSI